MRKRLLILIFYCAALFTIPVGAILSDWGMNNEELLTALPEHKNSEVRMLSMMGRSEALDKALSQFKEIAAVDEDVFEYVYDYSIAESLDLTEYREIEADNPVLSDYTYTSATSETAVMLNTTLASIYNRYMSRANLPLKDPLWLIAIGSVEYNYTINDPGLIFSFPVDIDAAKTDENYLLKYDWREVQKIGGDSAVLRRDGSSIGMLQLTSGYGIGYSPIIPEEFGIIGSESERRTDCWMTLGDGTSSGAAVVWKPGIDGDRWSPADNANIICGVYDTYFNNNPFSGELTTKYEKAILLMWSHNRGVGIINNPTYIQRSLKLGTKVDELLKFVEELKPVRFTRSAVLMDKVNEIAEICTAGDIYPVMALTSYLITECRYEGKW